MYPPAEVLSDVTGLATQVSSMLPMNPSR